MANIAGTNVTAPIVPYSEIDQYPTHDAKYGKGGYRTVADKTARDQIPDARLELGMAVRTIDDNVVWILTSLPVAPAALSDSHWTKETISVETIELDGGLF